MQKTDRSRRYCATGLVNFSACAHRMHLDLVNLDTPLFKAQEAEEMALIQNKGFAPMRRATGSASSASTVRRPT
jgi:hypothetical protein